MLGCTAHRSGLQHTCRCRAVGRTVVRGLEYVVMAVTDAVVIAVLAFIFGAMLAFDLWLRSKERD